MYRTCIGCMKEKTPCSARERMRASLKGLSITSVKWKCAEREDRFKRGQPVWVLTVDGSGEYDGPPGREEPFRDFYPALVIGPAGSRMLCFIEPGALGRDETGGPFKTTNGKGFCKIPLARIEPREGAIEELCGECDWSASKGHQEGYSCSVKAASCICELGHDRPYWTCPVHGNTTVDS